MTAPIVVTHNATASRFEAMVDGELCVADYHLVDGVMRIHHTGVAAPVSGRGIAAASSRRFRVRRAPTASRSSRGARMFAPT